MARRHDVLVLAIPSVLGHDEEEDRTSTSKDPRQENFRRCARYPTDYRLRRFGRSPPALHSPLTHRPIAPAPFPARKETDNAFSRHRARDAANGARTRMECPQ